MAPIRLLIVDDHSVVRQGLRSMIRVLPDMELAGEAAGGQEALDMLDAAKPDVVLMDLLMPEMDGATAIGAIKRRFPELAVIALTTFADAAMVHRALQAGVDGYLLKDVAVDELAQAIRSVYEGRPYLHPEATRHLLRTTTQPTQPDEKLTAREREVLALLARGRSNKEIADALVISRKTASVHVSNLLAKLQLNSRTQAALYALRFEIE
jgi:two-component system, NarL family, response regulator LiaR